MGETSLIMPYLFDVTTPETLERDFKLVKETCTDWEWETGYLHLYNSCKKRLIKKQLEIESKSKKK